MSNLHYRKASAQDAAEVAQFFIDNVDESYITASEVIWNRATPDGKWSPDLFEVVKQEIVISADAEDKLVLLFFLNERLVGYTFSAIKSCGAAEVEDFIIARDVRGLGLGKAINEITAEHLRQAGCTTLFMEVGANNSNMQKFVARDGMKETSKRYWKSI